MRSFSRLVDKLSVFSFKSRDALVLLDVDMPDGVFKLTLMHMAPFTGMDKFKLFDEPLSRLFRLFVVENEREEVDEEAVETYVMQKKNTTKSINLH